MKGTNNTAANKTTGTPLTPEAWNDVTKIATAADDDALVDLFGLEPPAAVTSTTPRVAFTPLRNGPVVVGDAAARRVTVNPLRAMRSSIDNTKPREALSAVFHEPTVVNLPAGVGAGLWRLELLYAQIAYVDASSPQKGTTCTLAFAPTGAGAAVAGAPSVATLPANTSTTWNVPLYYVKNVGGAVSIANEDILDVPPAVVGGFAQEYLVRAKSQKSGVDARRAYSSANHSPLKLVSGGGSAFTGTQVLTSTVTPAMTGRPGLEVVTREILVPFEKTGPNADAWDESLVVDDTRDWRGANVEARWWFGQLTNFGEDDNSIAGAHPCTQTGGGASWLYMSAGQSWKAHDPGGGFAPALGSKLWAATIGVSVGAPKIYGPSEMLPAGHVLALVVDAATGALKFARRRPGAPADGSTLWIVLNAHFRGNP
ncbi:MAG: hypothetical protein HYV09_40615 [Deltaproteobacteria bacterium]|nr:hypothetical protein [Deltaproteobacteria bacterium]